MPRSPSTSSAATAEPAFRDVINRNGALRLLAQQIFSRSAGAPLIGGNSIELLIDGRANYDAWLSATQTARPNDRGVLYGLDAGLFNLPPS